MTLQEAINLYESKTKEEKIELYNSYIFHNNTEFHDSFHPWIINPGIAELMRRENDNSNITRSKGNQRDN